MTREELADRIERIVKVYIENADSFDSNPQLRVNPVTLDVTIVNGRDMSAELEHTIEDIEAAAGAEGDAGESDTDYQVKRAPDFYATIGLIRRADGVAVPDDYAIEAVAANYLK